MNIPPGHAFPYESAPIIAKPPGSSVMYLVVGRRDVDQGDVRPLLSFVERWMKGETKLSAYGSRLALLFDGFNDDPRDLDQIPEVRTYVEAMEAAWPYLPLFLLPDEANQMLYWMLAGGGRRSPDGARRTVFGTGASMKAKARRFMEITAARLEELGVSSTDRRMQPFDAACRALADFLVDRRPFLRTPE